MYTIVMDKYKNLNTTVRAVIYKKENVVDKIQFLIPPTYGGNDGRTVVDEETGEETKVKDGVLDLTQFIPCLQYVDPNGNFHSEILVRDDEKYKDYLRYTLKVDTELTSVSGDVSLKIDFVDFNTEGVISKLKTNSTTIHINKPQGFDDYVNMDDIKAWKEQIDRMNSDINELQENIPTDLEIGDGDNLHLVHDDKQIGNGVEILQPVQFDELDGENDGIVDVDNINYDDGQSGQFIELE